jgi:hypothetical protein
VAYGKNQEAGNAIKGDKMRLGRRYLKALDLLMNHLDDPKIMRFIRHIHKEDKQAEKKFANMLSERAKKLGIKIKLR